MLRWNPVRLLAVFAALVASVLAPSLAAGVTGLKRVASGLSLPMYVTHAPGGGERLFIVEKGGTIRILDIETETLNPIPFLTIPDTDDSGDGGLQSMAFHPEFQSNGRFYVHVTVDNGGVQIDGLSSPFSSHIREYTVSANPDVADPVPVEILSWVQPRSNHNGGWIGFNPGRLVPEGGGPVVVVPTYLYIMSGDGGKQRDPDNNAQTLVDEFLGKVLRINVDEDGFPADPNRNYVVPFDNPFVGVPGDDEIWAYGLRNPWRASFDRGTGDLWIADVGQNNREEINRQLFSSPGGENYAWNRREGLSAHQGGALLPGDVEPIYDYGHGSGDFEGNSVVGGYVYRGPEPVLQRLYFFADTISGNVWLRTTFGAILRINLALVPDPPTASLDIPVSFGEDGFGNLYIVDHLDGEIFRILTNLTPRVPAFPWWGAALLALLLLVASTRIPADRSASIR